MEYLKPPLSLEDQIHKLKNRGLLIHDEEKAIHYLTNISFYRLRAYTYPFQDNYNPLHPFVKKVFFEEIISLYVFDRKLRILVFDALEKIEIALRCRITHKLSMAYGGHWFLNKELFRNESIYLSNLVSLDTEIKRSTEPFIDHYLKTYHYPVQPPAWMSLEVITIGLLSKMYSNLKKGDIKKQIAKDLGVSKVEILESWMHSLSGLRNICAHHCRLWNRRFTITPVLLDNPVNNYIKNMAIHKNKLYTQLITIKYLLNIISPNNEFSIKLKELLKSCQMIELSEMGFPDDWESESLWK